MSTIPPPGDSAAPEPTRVEGAILDPGVAKPASDPWSLSAEVLPGSPVPAADRPRGRGLTALVAGGVAAVLVGGAAVAWAAFNGDTGDQPEKHLPASAGAMLKVDLDPSGAQKIDAVRFFAKFPFGNGLRGTDDPRQAIYERLTEHDSSAPAWSQVEPWLGQRMALAALPGDKGHEPTPVGLLQVTDEAKAKATLAKAADADTAFSVADGWATISDTPAHVDAVTKGAAAKSLADDATFRRDVDALGDSGVFGGWADPGRFPDLADAAAPGALLGLSGAGLGQGDLLHQRFAMVARFTGGDAEVVLRSFGSVGTSTPTGAGPAVAGLPAGTVAAVGVSGAGDSVRKALTTGGSGTVLAQAMASAEQETGLKLPDDLEALLGQRFALALGQPDGSGEPVVGLRGQSDAAGLGNALDRLLRFTDASGLPLERRDVRGGYVLATNRAQAEALTRDGGLGGSDAFRDAVPDADRAAAVGYLDVERLLATYGQSIDADTAASLEPLRAVGLAVTPQSDGTITTLRVTTR